MVSPYELNRPRNEEIFTSPPEIVTLGEKMRVVYGAWGEEYDNKRFIKQFVVGHPNENDLIATINSTGITRRHFTIPPCSRIEHAAEIADQEVAVGAAVTRAAIKANKEHGWDNNIDLFIVAASAPACDDFAEQVANKAGVKAQEIKLYCMACNGVGAGVLDAMRRKELKNGRVVVTAVEGLSTALNLESQDPRDIVANSIFGSGASSLAFSPDESMKLLTGKTVIIPDREKIRGVDGEGVIRMPDRYQPPQVEEPLEPPAWHEGEREALAYGRKTVVMSMPVTRYGFIEMYGGPAGIFFKNIVPPVTFDSVDEYHQQFDQNLEATIEIGLFHQPSAVILDHAGRHLNKKLAAKGYAEMNVPWVLGRVGKGNTSADTILGAWGQAEKDRLIPKNRPFNITVFGAGASVTSMVVVVNPA